MCAKMCVLFGALPSATLIMEQVGACMTESDTRKASEGTIEEIAEDMATFASFFDTLVMTPVAASVFNRCATADEKSAFDGLSADIAAAMFGAAMSDDAVEKTEALGRFSKCMVRRSDIVARMVLRESPVSGQNLSRLFADTAQRLSLPLRGYAERLEAAGAGTLAGVARACLN